MKKNFDVAIIGGGVVGCMLFSDLSRNGYKAVLIEKEADVATGQSKANSGIIHAGFDAKPGTLKARFNVEGSNMYPSICKRLGLDLNPCGAYVVGDSLMRIKELVERGRRNGVSGLKILQREELLEQIPNLSDNIKCGLFAENSCIINPYLLTVCLAEEGVINGGEARLNFEPKSISRVNGIFEISDGENKIFSEYIINCAGAGYNEIARLLESETYNIEFRRGEYYVLDHSEKNLVRSTIFPLPTKAGKGVLITPTVDGNILVGPTSYESDRNTITTGEGLSDIRAKSSLILNNINLGKAIRIFSGVRTIIGEDFVVERSKIRGVINIAGICSPGLSSAPAISKYVISELLKFKYSFSQKSKKIKPYIKIADLPIKVQNKMIRKNPDYGKIVCKCENVSVGEIKDAINRPIKPTTMDGIKRRVRAGMGRCQGGFCNDKVVEILAKEHGIKFEEVLKEHKNSNYVKGNN